MRFSERQKAKCSMRFNRAIGTILLAMLLMIASGTDGMTALAADGTREILLVYPDAPDQSQKENLRVISEALTYMGRSVDYAAQTNAAQALEKYESVICYNLGPDAQFDAALAAHEGGILLLGCLPTGIPDEERYPRTTITSGESGGQITHELSGETFTALCRFDSLVLPQNPDETEGTITIGGTDYQLVSVWGKTRYIPLKDYRASLPKAVLARQMQKWLWPYEDAPHSYGQFVVIDGIYPFADPAEILTMVNGFVEQGVSFVLSVMPLYENGDYPAMQELCDVFRYAQANGGAVILHAPLIRGEIDPVELQERLTVATELLIGNGVYPIALQVPVSWTYDDRLRTVLGRYRTLFLYEDGEADETFDLSVGTNEFVTLGANLVSEAIALNAAGVSYLDCCATAVYIDAGTAQTDLLTYVAQEVRNSVVPSKSLWHVDNIVYLNDGAYLSYQGGRLTVNAEIRSLAYVARGEDEEYSYNRDVFYKAAISLKRENRVLMAFVTVALTLFIGSIFFARRQMRRRFFRDGGAGTRTPAEGGDV